ncbi:MAG TPA: hypothetical protein PKD56_05900, partial [Chitinophagales bacterium]|nr:hypothetical protein [Chitinophagales bacterium]
INFVFPGFSDIIKNKIDQIDNAKLRRARFNVENKDGSRTDARRLFADKLLSELKTALHTEVQQFINSDLLVLDDTKEVNEYPTKKTMNIISVNGGYGGAIFGGGLNDLDYDHAPYVGISFPLGKASLASPFWSKTSLSVGAFLNNFENKAGQTITGPVFQRPYYVGLGYKVFHFIRLNAGATFLEVKKPSSSGGIDLPDLKEVKIRPFVGASAEINLWMNLGSRNVNK